MYMIIYRIKNLINGKVYIGQTVRTLDERMKEHLKNSSVSPVGEDIKSNGLENFEISVVEVCKTQSELDEAEKYWIKKENCLIPYGYNQCEGGFLNTTGYHHTDEAKSKMSNAKKDKYQGKENPFYGKHHSKEQRLKWSVSRKGMKHVSSEKIQNIRNSHYTCRVLCIETNEIFNSIKEASDKYGLKATHITRVCRGKRKKTGGYHWKYIDNT